MCGIMAYIGNQEALPVILNGLKRLEYRGYDSAGVAILNDSLKISKRKGRVIDLEDHLKKKDLHGSIGIGHTRWATHGEPNDQNAHPHISGNGRIVLVHNGIIENYNAIREELSRSGHQFKSETDSEVLVHFIENAQSENNCSLEEATRIALSNVIGAYAIVILSLDEPGKLIAARKSSPLVIGVGGDNSYYVASDASPIIEHTKDVIYLRDSEIAIIDRNDLLIKDVNNVKSHPYVQTLEIDLDSIEKGGFDHFMLKEIFEQPRSIGDCMRGRLNPDTSQLMLGGIREYEDQLLNANRIIMIACGTSWHACLVAEYFFEEFCRIPVEVEYASEFRYRNPVIEKGDVVIAVSQSGETADTLAAIEMAKSKYAIVFGVCNVVGSSIARASHEGAYTHAGPEIGVASTKAFTAQLIVLNMIALRLAKKKGYIDQEKFKAMLVEMASIPEKVERALGNNEKIKEVAAEYKDVSNSIYLGRGYNFPVALEGALKLKEISYIHAEGYPAAEMKHGPIALIDENMPVVFIATKDSTYEKVVSNIQEVKARKGKIIAVVTEHDDTIKKFADHILEVPEVSEALSPLLTVIPLQLLAYHIAVMRDCNVDQPRNLAKSVTVE
jgi:glucosamine--fructose-6-phosphate aminotransferase (isomerizing)